MSGHEYLDNIALVPWLTALTVSEYFSDQKHKNVLLLMDNVFRFVQAGAEVASILG